MASQTDEIKKLRDLTGAGVLDAKRTLESMDGDFNKALALLKVRGAANAEKKGGRETKQGLVETYVHQGGKIGAMVELACETDFVARTEDFKNLAHDLALQIAATKPKYVSSTDVPVNVLADLKITVADAAKAEGKKPDIVEKIVAGKLESFYRESCLLNQAFIRDANTTIQDLVKATIAKLGENIVVRRFARFELGE
ncbi:MAG: elongation factor Ts [Chloroflexi bacterium]|nr:elongation factor Ts [Chloroflexota bacterium]